VFTLNGRMFIETKSQSYLINGHLSVFSKLSHEQNLQDFFWFRFNCFNSFINGFCNE